MARIDASNARSMALRSHEARRQRQAMRGNPPAIPQSSEESTVNFPEQRLACVREQIDLLSNRLTVELKNPKTEPIDIDRLTKSLASMREDERRYAGRSLPPTIKAAPPKRERQRVPMIDPT